MEHVGANGREKEVVEEGEGGVGWGDGQYSGGVLP